MNVVFDKIKPYFKYIFIFFIFLFWNLIVQPVNLDEIWNYGFSHNIYSGLVPYKDFNMVITPLFPFLFSLGFYIAGSSMLVLHIEQALIITITFAFLYYFLKEKSYIVLIFMIFPLSVVFPSYNFFLFLLWLIVIFLEEKKYNDYLIGFVLACLFLTKQSVGVVCLLPTIYYLLKDWKKVLKRAVGFSTPIIIFVIYLLITESFYQFIDLCFLGLFDFAEGNGRFNIFSFLSILLFFLILWFITKDRNDIKNYYLLAFFSVVVPLFDLYHFQIWFLAILVICLLKVSIKKIFYVKIFSIGCLIGFSWVVLQDNIDGKIVYPNKINHFEYRYVNNAYIDLIEGVNILIKKYESKKIVFISADGYCFKIINDMTIEYLDLINNGNWGYDGSSKLLSEIMDTKNAVFFVDQQEFGDDKQTDQQVLKYILDNGTKIDKTDIYSIYVLEE